MIAVISGTNRKDSLSLKVARTYTQVLESAGEPCQIIDLGTLPSDFTVSALYENAGRSAGFNLLKDLVHEAEKYVFVVPEYNNSFPGVLKAFIDGLDYPSQFAGKKGALVGISSGGQGAGIALSHLTDVLNYLGMHVLASKVKLPNIHKHMDEERLTNERSLKMLQKQAHELIDF